MKYTTLWGAMLLAALLLAACGPAAPVTGVPTQLEPLATAVVGTATGLSQSGETTATTSATAVATESPAVVSTQSTTATTEASVPVTGEATIKATISDNYGPILVDSGGVAVYIYSKDTQNGSASACTDEECTSEWTPVTTAGEPVAGAGAIQKFLGTITREDGTMQVTYNGWPLYYSSTDNGPGSTNGQGAEDAWYLVAPSGKAIRE